VLKATFDGGPIVTSSETNSSSEKWTFVTPYRGRKASWRRIRDSNS
jgi:hypothetical protein